MDSGRSEDHELQAERVSMLLAVLRDSLSSLSRASSHLEREVTAALPAAFGETEQLHGLREELRSLREENAQLRESIASRAVIEQAKGILMGKHGCSADDAFEMLSTMSRAQRRKVRQLAAEVVAAATRPKNVVDLTDSGREAAREVAAREAAREAAAREATSREISRDLPRELPREQRGTAS